jgi:UDP-N-acetylmuramoyl-tripeptide--D-alanyl-D-alanine ligase
MTAQWGEINAQEIATQMGGRQIFGSPDVALGGLSTDSRTIAPGHIFLALKGEQYDGHHFLADAVNAGAAGVIVEPGATIPEDFATKGLVVITVASTLQALGDLALWWRKQWGGKLIAVTGSNGKTTTKEMAASILSLTANTKKSPGNFNNLIGLPLTILSLKQDHRLAVLEMGMNRPGEIARLTQIARPDIGLITNAANAHLEGLGDVQGVIKAKGELLEVMSEDSIAILNGDGELYDELAPTCKGKLVSFGLGEANQIRAGNIRAAGFRGQAFDIYLNNERVSVKIGLPGIHNVCNAVGGAAIAHCLSVSKELIAQGLGEFTPLKGRFQVTDLNDGVRIIDDTYNSNPSSLNAALQTVQELRAERQGLVVGFGEMMELGQEASRYHVDAGKRIADMGTRYVVALGEHGGHVIEGACQGGMKRTQTHLAANHAEMIDALKAKVRGNDIVLLKGSRKVAMDRVVEAMKEFYGTIKG